jgi:hypothetical protein
MTVSNNYYSCPFYTVLGLILGHFFLTMNAEAKPIETRTIIAVGDLHADLPSAKKAFAIAGITDAQGKWAVSDTIVVQTGDLTDRGPDGQPLLEWVRSLEIQAKKYNSQFIVLLGNHEVMNLQGDWRYVSQADVQSFGGLEQRKQAFTPGGEWSDWLSTKDAVLQIGDTIFVHGGVSRQFARPAETLSQEVRLAMLGQGDRSILSEKGPLWYRGYWRQTELQACEEAQFVLEQVGAKRMVMGHTTQRDGQIHSRCNGTLFAIDTGISRHYGEHPSALRLTGDIVEALYESGVVQLSSP